MVIEEKPHYVHFTPAGLRSLLTEFSSFLTFTELRFGLAPLSERDAHANNMLDSFDFSQSPLAPVILNNRGCPASEAAPAQFIHEN